MRSCKKRRVIVLDIAKIRSRFTQSAGNESAYKMMKDITSSQLSVDLKKLSI